MEEFVRRYKLECRDVKGASECMKISRFIHGITNPELINDYMIKSLTARSRTKAKLQEGRLPEPTKDRAEAGQEDGMEGPMIIEAEMGGHCVYRMYVDGGSFSEILYEHCFNRFHPKVRNQMIPATTPLVGFSGEIIWSLGKISLLVKIGDDEHSNFTWMNFMAVRSPSPYNKIIGRLGVRIIQAVPSIAYEMLKFLVVGGTVTLRSSRIIPLECTMVSGPWVSQPVINQVTEEKIQVAIHPEYLEQTIAIGYTLTKEGRKELCGLLRRNLDVFAWKSADMTGVPWYIAEHRLNIRKGCLPVRQNKKGKHLREIRQYTRRWKSWWTLAS
ncbi:hypothetical protein Tco_1035389 [Tanacetum coccineum]